MTSKNIENFENLVNIFNQNYSEIRRFFFALREFPLKLERTRGAGAPEVLGRETAEEEFRLRRNVPLIWRLRRQNSTYTGQEILRNFFKKVDFLRGPGK